MLTELAYRQKQLDIHIDKYYDGFYDDYIYVESGRLIVFLKYLKTKKRNKSRTINIDGIISPLVNI